MLSSRCRACLRAVSSLCLLDSLSVSEIAFLFGFFAFRVKEDNIWTVITHQTFNRQANTHPFNFYTWQNNKLNTIHPSEWFYKRHMKGKKGKLQFQNSNPAACGTKYISEHTWSSERLRFSYFSSARCKISNFSFNPDFPISFDRARLLTTSMSSGSWGA